ncbi:YciI family protein [Rhizobium sp. P40RR-XXII]|uniref:YciI family protein n=1 Tax=unclassified Rhizobium TaxID=2613769 RepID=UPI00145654C0|nr:MULTISPECIES: YciI family protein [unclassified Rhizobium]NLR87536.1 YciI family protein [Rhizobium sp. P28RR-XV]NLS18196.1 YciI family protein [Rhizobium sp. P40RR-XXII]
MYYAILAYHEEGIVESWSKEEDAALMTELLEINDRMVAQKSLGPAARLGSTQNAVTLRGPGAGLVIDGPFAETKEQLLGFYVVDFPMLDAAVEAARELRRANPTAVYEIRPVALYLPGAPLPSGEGS